MLRKEIGRNMRDPANFPSFSNISRICVLPPTGQLAPELQESREPSHISKFKVRLSKLKQKILWLWRQRGRVARAPGLKSRGRGFKSCSDH